MEIEIPPHIAVTQLFRHQRERKRAFRAWFDEVYARTWRDYRPKGSALRDFAAEYEPVLRSAAAFDVQVQGSPDRILLNTAKPFEMEGKVLWPIGLGQEASQPEIAYAEDALLISRVGLSVAANKVTAHEAPLGLCLTKHAILRLVERRGIEGEVGGCLSEALPTFIGNAALVLALGISKNVDGDDWSRTAYVPFRTGIMVLTNRIVAAEGHNQDVGWRFSFTKRRYTSGYVKPALLQPDFRASRYTGMGMWFATTFIGADQLTAPQAQYAETLTSFATGASPLLKDTAFGIQFDPDYVARDRKTAAVLNDVDEQAYGRLRLAVEGNLFRLHPREGFAFLIEPDTSSRAFRSMLSHGT